MAITGYYSKPGASAAATQATAVVEPQAIPLSTAGLSSEISESTKRGAQLLNSLGCIGCHRVNGKGGVIGPELSPNVLRGKSPVWLTIQIRDPKAHYPNSIMPPFSSLSDQQINDLVDFLLTLAQGKEVPTGHAVAGPTPAPSSVPLPGPARVKVLGPQAPPGPASYIIGNADLGEYLFKQNCEQCHGVQGKDKVPNPGSTDGTVPPLNPIDPTLSDKKAQTFVSRIDPYIQHGSIPAGPNPVLHMLPFGDSKSLTQQMIANVEAYVLHLNGVDRAQLVHPGIQPRYFFWLVVIVFGCVLGGFCIWKGRAR
jgi:ubiquinol-cytochrome c reductase cytochrome b subunit